MKVLDVIDPVAPLALETDETALGLRRAVARTDVGEIVVRVGRPSGGPATILLHGAAGSWTTWTPLLRAADRAGTPLTDVIAPDLPGWGESGGGVGSVAEISVALATLARSLGYESWRIAGHSLGGLIALDLAAREPRATIGVALVSPTGAGVLDAIRRPVRGGVRERGAADRRTGSAERHDPTDTQVRSRTDSGASAPVRATQTARKRTGREVRAAAKS